MSPPGTRPIRTLFKKRKGPKGFIDRTLEPLAKFLESVRIGPNTVTLAGLLVTLMVPVELLQERWVAAGFWLLGAGFFDVLDGSMARNLGVQGPFGAFWDSTLDRVSEAIVFGGLLLYYGQKGDRLGLLLAFTTCILSLLVSYTRARAEGLGIDCEVGILPRPGRVILLAIGFFAALPLQALAVIGALSLITVWQRVNRVREQTIRVKSR